MRRGPASRIRYERERPGELVHVDVKKLGRIPEGGGWRAHGRGSRPGRLRATGYDYLHAAIDDHSRMAYAELHPDERGETCAGFLARAAAFFERAGISRIERVMTDGNAMNYRHSAAFTGALSRPGRSPHPDSAPLPVDQRQERAAQPHAPSGVGLRARLRLQRRAGRVPGTLHRALQHAPPPQRARRPSPDQPPVNNLVSDYI